MRELHEPLGIYSWHPRNWVAKRPLEERIKIGVEEFDFYFQELDNWSRKLQLPFELEEAKRRSWFNTLAQALKELEREVPEGSRMILIDEDHWCAGSKWAGRNVLPLLEKDGRDWWLPETDEVAVRELKKVMLQEARHVVFCWSTFWWREHYKGLDKLLSENSSRVASTDRIKVFHLSPPKGS